MVTPHLANYCKDCFYKRTNGQLRIENKELLHESAQLRDTNSRYYDKIVEIKRMLCEKLSLKNHPELLEWFIDQ